jgi:hypothetical protein
MIKLPVLDSQNLQRLQHHLRRTGVLIEKIMQASKKSTQDTKLDRLCGDELVGLLGQVRRYRSDLDLLVPSGLMHDELSMHLNDLTALRHNVLAWITERSEKKGLADETQCGQFEPIAWRTLGSGIVWLQILESNGADPAPLDNPSSLADWWGDTEVQTLPAKVGLKVQARATMV